MNGEIHCQPTTKVKRAAQRSWCRTGAQPSPVGQPEISGGPSETRPADLALPGCADTRTGANAPLVARAPTAFAHRTTPIGANRAASGCRLGSPPDPPTPSPRPPADPPAPRWPPTPAVPRFPLPPLRTNPGRSMRLPERSRPVIPCQRGPSAHPARPSAPPVRGSPPRRDAPLTQAHKDNLAEWRAAGGVERVRGEARGRGVGLVTGWPGARENHFSCKDERFLGCPVPSSHASPDEPLLPLTPPPPSSTPPDLRSQPSSALPRSPPTPSRRPLPPAAYPPPHPLRCHTDASRCHTPSPSQDEIQWQSRDG